MTNLTAPKANRAPITFTRVYDGPVEDLWDLWTTRDGFESWWGPEGFRVTVHTLDLRVGGALFFDMIAVGAREIEYMKGAGRPLSHETRGMFVEIVPNARLKVRFAIDFLPGVPSYDIHFVAEFVAEGGRVRMVVTVDPHHDAEWTRMAAQGMESQLTKLPAALEARRRRA